MISFGAFILALAILVAGVLYDNHRRRQKAAIHRASFRPAHVIEFCGVPGEAGVTRTPNATPWARGEQGK